MLYEIESAKKIDQVCQDLEKAVAGHKFGVLTNYPQPQGNHEEKGS